MGTKSVGLLNKKEDQVEDKKEKQNFSGQVVKKDFLKVNNTSKNFFINNKNDCENVEKKKI